MAFIAAKNDGGLIAFPGDISYGLRMAYHFR
jgi:hypothetical protein